MDDVNSSELLSLSKCLVQTFLQSHRSREVRGLVSCCIADVFRLCYPDPPYDERERKVKWLKDGSDITFFFFKRWYLIILCASFKDWRNHHHLHSNTASSSLRCVEHNVLMFLVLDVFVFVDP